MCVHIYMRVCVYMCVCISIYRYTHRNISLVNSQMWRKSWIIFLHKPTAAQHTLRQTGLSFQHLYLRCVWDFPRLCTCGGTWQHADCVGSHILFVGACYIIAQTCRQDRNSQLLQSDDSVYKIAVCSVIIFLYGNIATFMTSHNHTLTCFFFTLHLGSQKEWRQSKYTIETRKIPQRAHQSLNMWEIW